MPSPRFPQQSVSPCSRSPTCQARTRGLQTHWERVAPIAVSRAGQLSPALMRWQEHRPGDLSDRLSSYSCAPIAPSERQQQSQPQSTWTMTPPPERPKSKQASLIVQRSSANSRKTSSGPPSLSQATSNSGPPSSASKSIDTDFASSLGTQNLLYDEGDGNLVVPLQTQRPREVQSDPATYQCLFHILLCDKTFDNTLHWKTHVLSHFRTSPPPTSARCPLCSYASTDTERGVAWDNLLNHLATNHLPQGHTLAHTSPDFELLHYMYCVDAITQDQLQLIQLSPAPHRSGYTAADDSIRARMGSSEDPCSQHASARRERRMRERRPRFGIV